MYTHINTWKLVILVSYIKCLLISSFWIKNTNIILIYLQQIHTNKYIHLNTRHKLTTRGTKHRIPEKTINLRTPRKKRPGIVQQLLVHFDQRRIDRRFPFGAIIRRRSRGIVHRTKENTRQIDSKNAQEKGVWRRSASFEKDLRDYW